MTIHVLLEMFHRATGIPLTICNENLSIEFAYNDFRSNLAHIFLSTGITPEHTAFTTLTPQNLLLGMIRHKEKILLLGPVTSFECTPRQIIDISEVSNLTQAEVDNLAKWLRSLPLYTNQRFRYALELFYTLLHDGEVKKISFIPYTHFQSTSYAPDHPTALHTLTPSGNNPFFRCILSCIKYGQCDRLESSLRDFSVTTDHLPDFGAGINNNLQSLLIISTTLACNSAQEGNVPFKDSTALAEKYYRLANEIETDSDFDILFKQMLMEFAQKTARHRIPDTDSVLATKICQDIHAHLYEKISVKEISERLGHSSEHLCRHFISQTGLTITQYIQREKITESKKLLETTDLSISEISACLGFSSSSYFHKVFAQQTGLPPSVYRKQLRM
ncbi:MAG: helix-turn-helix transcriptional regulator [Lachnospiraceae bacterium]|nr:helix-turn-helix transcriptional regulator [Lachnospiraceae bacterium]